MAKPQSKSEEHKANCLDKKWILGPDARAEYDEECIADSHRKGG